MTVIEVVAHLATRTPRPTQPRTAGRTLAPTRPSGPAPGPDPADPEPDTAMGAATRHITSTWMASRVQGSPGTRLRAMP